MKRISLEGPSPHFIGCWNIEQNLLCDEIVNFFESHQEKQEPGQSAGAVNLEAKNSTDITVHPRDLKTDEYKVVKNYIDTLFACYEDYTQQFPFLGTIMPSTDVGSFNIQKYLPGGHFKLPHSERTSIVNSFRVLAWMSYLNDVEDGGATKFTHQNMEVTPRKGKTLIWPAEWTHAHLGNIVNSGEKYIITGWMHFPHEVR
jgi:hypothetical protein